MYVCSYWLKPLFLSGPLRLRVCTTSIAQPTAHSITPYPFGCPFGTVGASTSPPRPQSSGTVFFQLDRLGVVHWTTVATHWPRVLPTSLFSPVFPFSPLGPGLPPSTFIPPPFIFHIVEFVVYRLSILPFSPFETFFYFPFFEPHAPFIFDITAITDTVTPSGSITFLRL